MRPPMFRIASGFLPVNLAACSARAQPPVREAPLRSSPTQNAWRCVVVAGRFMHLPLPASWVASTKS